VGSPISPSPQSPEETTLLQLPRPSIGGLLSAESSANNSELEIRVVSPEGSSTDSIPVLPSPSLAARGRSPPTSGSWDAVHTDDIPIPTERSPPPAPALATMSWERRGLMDSGRVSPLGSWEYSPLVGRQGGRGLRTSDNVPLFRTRRNI
jgi:hypothetical protein